MKDKPGMVTLTPFAERDVSTQMMRRRRASERKTLPTIRVIAGPDMLRFCSLSPSETIVIGRDDDCQLPLGDASVSRRHAQLTAMGDAILLEDLGSTNGTTYDGDPVTRPIQVQLGKEISVGTVTLRLEELGMDELAHLARVMERLNMAAKDPLTGLLSRHTLDAELPNQVMRYHRAHIPMAAVFLDVDDFKKVNDTLGHGVGDEVLRTVARLVAMSVRETDTAVRYGGEEFVLILTNCDEVGGALLAERIRQAIEGHDWAAHAPEGKALAVTVSLGVAEYLGEDVKDWLDRADRAMYRAKKLGRNKTVMASQVQL